MTQFSAYSFLRYNIFHPQRFTRRRARKKLCFSPTQLWKNPPQLGYFLIHTQHRKSVWIFSPKKKFNFKEIFQVLTRYVGGRVISSTLSVGEGTQTFEFIQDFFNSLTVCSRKNVSLNWFSTLRVRTVFRVKNVSSSTLIFFCKTFHTRSRKPQNLSAKKKLLL